jgi:hypothetical protein
MYYPIFSYEQYFFEKVIQVIWLLIRVAFALAMYSSMIFSGMFISRRFLTTDDSSILWIAFTALFAFLFYLLVYFIKGLIVGMAATKSSLWVPLLMIVIAYACVFPITITFPIVENVIELVSKKYERELSWLVCLSFAFYIYSRYRFLSDNAPVVAFPCYQMGLNLALLIR